MSLGSSLLKQFRLAGGLQEPFWHDLLGKEATAVDHAKMVLALTHADIKRVEPIGRGIHRPYRVSLQTQQSYGFVDCREAVFKTVYSQRENKAYSESVDMSVSGPEREFIAYQLDQVMGFDLVPPVVLRNVEPLSAGSLMAWVRQPLAIDWIRYQRYDYRKHPENPWLHKIAAFDFITGQLDRHAANFILDSDGRVYAIDNGYSFVMGDDRRYMKCNPGRALVGHQIHPIVKEIIQKIDPYKIRDIMNAVAFHNDELYGVLTRLKDLRSLTHWEALGGKWVKPDPKVEKKINHDPSRDWVIAVDFDDTIIDPDTKKPLIGAVEGVRSLKDNGWVVVIWTCRSNTEEVESILNIHGIPFDYINQNVPGSSPSSRKIHFDLVIDNKNVPTNTWERMVRWAEDSRSAVNEKNRNALTKSMDPETMKVSEVAVETEGSFTFAW